MCNDLSTLYERLFIARNEWCDIGLKLKLSIESLNEIELKLNSKTCLRKMLAKRLEAVGPLSWREVCACLRSPTVGRNDVADTIEEWRKGTVDSGNRLSSHNFNYSLLSNRSGQKALYNCSSSFSFIISD